MQAETEVLEGLDRAAKVVARKLRIPYADAYRIMLERNPSFYNDYIEERDSHGYGTSAARVYLETADRIARRNLSLR
jgi:hypothetical protein